MEIIKLQSVVSFEFSHTLGQKRTYLYGSDKGSLNDCYRDVAVKMVNLECPKNISIADILVDRFNHEF